jgi:Protein of unknown function (DUF3263)
MSGIAGSVHNMTSVLPRIRADVTDVGVTDIDVDALDDINLDDIAAETAAPTEAVSTNDNAEAVPALTDRQQHMLVFERQWWRHAGSKEQAIREQFNLSATRYYQMLNQLLDVPAALAFDPLVVGRLRRLRATRSRARTAR